MQVPNQIFSKVILQYRGKRAGLWLTLQNIFVLLFLGTKVHEVSPVSSKEMRNIEVRCYYN